MTLTANGWYEHSRQMERRCREQADALVQRHLEALEKGQEIHAWAIRLRISRFQRWADRYAHKASLIHQGIQKRANNATTTEIAG